MNTELEQDEIFHSLRGEFHTDRTGLVARILDSWRDMRGATRRLISENPSEPRLLFYVLMSDMVFFLSWSLKTVVSPTEAAASILPREVGLWLIMALFLRTLVVYVFAGVLGAILRVFGGTGSWKDTRTGIFWGSFVAAPFGLLFAIVTVLFSTLENTIPLFGNTFVAQAPYWMALLPFVWLCSVGAAEAHGFKRSAPLFMGMTVLTMVVWVWFLVLRAQGVI